MKKMLALVAMLAACAWVQAEECLTVGDSVGAFNVVDVTGPSAGEKLCYRCQYGNRPVVTVFARKMTPEVASLTKEIDTVVGSNSEKKMAAFVVMLTDQPESVESTLKTVAKEQGIKNTPLTTFDGNSGPANYKLAEDSVRQLAARGILRTDFVESLMRQRLQEHPGYYGEMVWISMMLEQWLRVHAPDFRVA